MLRIGWALGVHCEAGTDHQLQAPADLA